MDRKDLWSTATAATPFDVAGYDDLTQVLSPRVTAPQAGQASSNPFDDFGVLAPPSPKMQDGSLMSPRRNSFHINNLQGLRGHLQQPTHTMYIPPRAPQQHMQNPYAYGSTPGYPTMFHSAPGVAMTQPTAAMPPKDAFDPFNPATAAAFNTDNSPQRRGSESSSPQRRGSESSPQRRGSESSPQRRGSESHRMSEEIAFDPFALDATFSVVPVEEDYDDHDDDAGKQSDLDADEEATSQGRPSEQERVRHDMLALLSMREQQLVSGERYTVTYPSKTRLGLLLERKDEWIPGCAERSERAVVRMVVAGTESEVRGVTSGSKVVAVNGDSMLSVPYSEVLEVVRKARRPVTIEFERAPLATPNDEVAGEGYFRISRSPYAPSSMDEWESIYFVIGGAIAKPNVFQVYENKQEFEDTVVALFRKEKVTTRVQVFKLDMQCKLSVIKEKRYGAVTMRFFSLKPANYKFKSIKIGVTRNFEQLRKLHAQMARFTTAA